MSSSELNRIELVTTVLASPPRVHRFAGPTQVWSTERSCYEFMARHVSPGSRTLETGAGVSTVLFTAWGCEHLCVVPVPKQRDVILSYCEESGIDAGALRFDLRGSEVALPEIPRDSVFDLVFIDGSHGFPIPIIDWFYGAGLLREGGIVVFDDLGLPQVSHWLEWFLDKDPRWERLDSTTKWAAYRRHSSGPLSELQVRQPFLEATPTSRFSKAFRKFMRRGRTIGVGQPVKRSQAQKDPPCDTRVVRTRHECRLYDATMPLTDPGVESGWLSVRVLV